MASDHGDAEGERKRGFAWQKDEEYLRNVEREVLIPKKMRDKARVRCAEKVDAFTRCCKESGIAMVVKCRKENSELKECVTNYYKDPEFFEMCKQEYLAERAEFRATGISKKKRQLLEQQETQRQQGTT